MPLSNEQIENLGTLLKSDDFGFVQQGMTLGDTLCNSEQDFRRVLTVVKGEDISVSPTIEEMMAIFGNLSRCRSLFPSYWALNKLGSPFPARVDLGYLGLETVPSCVYEWTHTQMLDLGSNALSSVSDSIGQLTHLRYLILYFNRLTQLPKGLGRLTQLTALNAPLNDITVIPDCLHELSNLQLLELFSNKLTQFQLMN
mgnify:CR=1 FL=1